MNKFIICPPQIFINKPLDYVLKKLEKLIGKEAYKKIFDIKTPYKSPVCDEKNSKWLQTSKIIGINPRIIGTYFNIVKYAMTFPENSIHIMPIWEMGCNGGIYSRINWKLSEEWLDMELCMLGFNTPEKQMKFVINALHALGKTVCFDITPHTDKFSEEVFIEPECFEWIKLNENKTEEIKFEDTNDIYPLVKNCILSYLKENNCADNTVFMEFENFFSDDFSDTKRSLILFGDNLDIKTKRRISLMNYLRKEGFETLPVTEHSPRRPIIFDYIKKEGDIDYAVFKVADKSKRAKIFNSITPYRWYKLDKEGYINSENKIEKTFEYFFKKIASIQKEYNIDFIRADMAHNQISHSDKKEEKNINFQNEMWKLLKERIQKENNVPYFAVFAEAFLDNYYINGVLDMINKDFDAILGTSNFTFLNEEFIDLISYYTKLKEECGFAPCIASITNDSDRIENNDFHISPLANEIRYFIQMFYGLTGYTGMGFEVRNNVPVSEFEYSGGYTNYMKEKYIWGDNKKTFKTVTRIRKLYAKLKDKNLESRIVSTSESINVLMWVLYDRKTNEPLYLCYVNLDLENKKKDVLYSVEKEDWFDNKKLTPLFSLNKNPLFLKTIRAAGGKIPNSEFTDAVIYKFENIKKIKKNKNQILILTTELIPYAKAGGLADFCAEFANAYKDKYKNQDIRFILPLYNAECASFDRKNLYAEFSEKSKDGQPVRYKLKETKVCTKFSYGLYNSSVKLYKAIGDENYTVYFAYSKSFSYIKKPYEEDETHSFLASFGNAAAHCLKYLNRYENFNPYLVIANDHLCAHGLNVIKNLKMYDRFYEGIKTHYIIHNPTYPSLYGFSYAFILLFDKRRIKDIINNSPLKKLIDKIGEKYNIKGKSTELPKLIYENNNLSEDKDYIIYKNIIRTILKDKLEDNRYIVAARCVECSNVWSSVSDCIYKNLSEKKIFKLDITKYKDKGFGILSGINTKNYDPNDGKYIEFPYNENNFIEGKIKNKIYLQKELSKENFKNGTISKKLINKDNVDFFGYLGENKNSLLLFYASRAAEITKGLWILEDFLFDMLDKYENVQLIIASEGIKKYSNVIFNSEKIIDYLAKGRLFIVDGFVEIRQFFAASDIYITPSLIEACGLSVMQALRYGCIPVMFNTGCAPEILNSNNGFTSEKEALWLEPDIVKKSYREVLYKAVELCSNADFKNKMQFSAMKTDVGWSSWKLEKYKMIFDKLKSE